MDNKTILLFENILPVLCKDILNSVHDGVYIVDKKMRIIFWNEEAEKITGFLGEEVLGNTCSNNILKHVDSSGLNLCLSACPLMQTLKTNQKLVSEVFLHHKNGHRVPIQIETSPLIINNKLYGAIEFFRKIGDDIGCKERLEILNKQSLVDHLTGISNRRHIDITIERKILEFNRYGWDFSIALFDIDNFKTFNDNYGHTVGDDILKIISKTITGSLRSFDFLGRWGGEEFLAILPEIDSDEQLKKYAIEFLELLQSQKLGI
ncbi:GGDEF domain-containing protein [Solidesulfovibrio magneticus]|nr:GGDEF domain-containing protein [Solidesulfovibrio magneticus]